MSYTASGYEIYLSRNGGNTVLLANATTGNTVVTDFVANSPLDLADTSLSSLSLVRRGTRQYSDIIATDLIHLLENFYGSVSPANPLNGQLWYDNNADTLKVYNNSSTFVPVGGGLSANAVINLSGDASGTVSFSTGGSYTLPVTLNSVVAPGTYEKVQVDATGRVIMGSMLTSSDIITALGYTPGASGAGSVTYVGGAGTANISVTGGPITSSGTLNIDLLPTSVGGGTYTKVTVDSFGRVQVGANLSGSDIAAALGYTPLNYFTSTTLSVGGPSGGLQTVDLPAIGGGGSGSNISYDSFGRVTSASNLTQSELVSILGSALSTTSANNAPNGWHKDLQTGTIFQWGKFTATEGTAGTVSLPITFPNQIFSVVLTPLNASSLAHFPSLGHTAPTTTNFAYTWQGWTGGSQACSIYFMAIGF